jgi:RNA polymerase sigma-70 factor (ECF subfamily)
MAEFAPMPTTLWTQISAARRIGGDALEDLLRKYRPPVYSFIRRMGADPSEADDLTQEVLLRVIEDDVLARADRAVGRFRSFLLAVVRHTVLSRRRHARRWKRGGRVRHVPLHGPEEEDFDVEAALAAPPVRDEEFDALWVQNLVRLALDRLGEECARTGRPFHKALLLFTEQGLSYPEIAASLSGSRSDVKNWLHQARLRIRKYVLAAIREYSSSAAEYRDEAAYLDRFLK